MTMIGRAVVTLAAVALGAGVFVPSVARAQNVCTKKACAEEIDAGCAGLSGMALSTCTKAVIAQCKIMPPICSCTDPTLPMCTPTTTTTTTSTTTSSSTTTTTSSTTTSSSTTTTTSSTTTTTASSLGAFLEFTTSSGGGAFCGQTLNGTGGLIKNLSCGGLNVGGGGSIVEEGPTPDGATYRFTLDCTGPTGTDCVIGPYSTAPAANSADPDCTDTGCNFGTPLEIPNALTPALTTCALNTYSSPAGGFLDGATGAYETTILLDSALFLTGNLTQPCPRCYSGGVPVSGSPSSPATGNCDVGPNAGDPCTTTNSVGLTRDCLVGAANPPVPGFGVPAGPLAINFSPLTTDTVTVTAPTGFFCPGQVSNAIGCFSGAGSNTCRTIIENGSPAGPITPGTPADTTLAAVFCIPATGDALVNSTARLPGPGAVSLIGTAVVF
jgi:hypothetical protein